MINKDGGHSCHEGGHSCHEGGHRAHGGPPVLPLGKTLIVGAGNREG